MDELKTLGETGDLEGLEKLLARHPDLVCSVDRTQVSPLMQALYRGRRDVADVLLRSGWTLDPFEAAALDLPEDLERALAAAPESLNAVSPDGFTALHFAVFFGGEAAAEELLSRGAELEIVSKNGLAVTPLQSALARSKVNGALALLAAGADVEAATSPGWRPLHYCAAHNLPDVAKELLRRGADPHSLNPDGKTAVQLAAEAGAAEIFALL
jgi:ankyrin repeat protein